MSRAPGALHCVWCCVLNVIVTTDISEYATGRGGAVPASYATQPASDNAWAWAPPPGLVASALYFAQMARAVAASSGIDWSTALWSLLLTLDMAPPALSSRGGGHQSHSGSAVDHAAAALTGGGGLCPVKGLTQLSKLAGGFLVPVMAALPLALLHLVVACCRCRQRRRRRHHDSRRNGGDARQSLPLRVGDTATAVVADVSRPGDAAQPPARVGVFASVVFVGAWTQLLAFTASRVLGTCFKLLRCASLPDGEHRLYFAGTVQCDEWWRGLVVAAAVVSLGQPTLLLLLSLWQRRRTCMWWRQPTRDVGGAQHAAPLGWASLGHRSVNDGSRDNDLSLSDDANATVARSSTRHRWCGARALAALEAPYRDGCQWWWSLALAHRVGLVVVYTFAVDAAVAAAASTAVTAMAMVAHTLARPFRSAVTNAAQSAMLFELLLLTAWLGQSSLVTLLAPPLPRPAAQLSRGYGAWLGFVQRAAGVAIALPLAVVGVWIVVAGARAAGVKCMARWRRHRQSV